ncbi:MAG: anthranilate phosphoribosyltransferase, partial [Alphaproteobacteria bacterium]
MSADMNNLKPMLARVADRETLDEVDAEKAFDIIMSGNATPAQIGAFLMALRVRGETVDEITGAARVSDFKDGKVSTGLGSKSDAADAFLVGEISVGAV